MRDSGRYDYLIVGAGLTGAVLARELTDAGATCLVIEKRDHIGGNAYDEVIEGVTVHRYGPHLFHTNSERVWNYVNRFSEWLPYEYRVKVIYQGMAYSFPPNLMTYQQLGISLDDPSLPGVLFETFFRGYSSKQWGRPADEVPSSIIKRIPIRYDYDDRYFSDRYQGLPIGGYTSLIHQMLQGIPVELGADYLAHRPDFDRLASRTIYTGPIDSLYNFKLGRLEYRSLRFETHKKEDGDYHGSATFNYTDTSPDYTRTHNWRYFGWQNTKTNIITHEYPMPYDGTNDPYYPINDEANNSLHSQYEAQAKEDRVIVAGRLGKYRYYDMHQAIAAALTLSESLIKQGKYK